MSNIDFFSSKIDVAAAQPSKPFFTVKDKPPKELLDWLKNEILVREGIHSPFVKECHKNLTAYKGEYFRKPNVRQTDSNQSAPLNVQTSKYFVNHIYEMTENMVSRMTRVKPAVDVLPANDEYDDKVSAKAVDLLLRHLFYINDSDAMIQKMHRHRLIFGEAFLEIGFDPHKGDLSPAYVEAREAGGEVDGPIRIGDVGYTHRLPWDVLLDNVTDYDKVKSVFIKELVDIEDLKHEHPDKAKDITPDKISTSFNVSTLRHENMSDKVIVYHFYYAADQHCPEGRHIKMLHNLILSDGDLGYSHGAIPLLRLTDLDVPGVLHGVSRYSQVLNLQNAHNNISQSIIKNEFLMSAPKWMMPKGACKIEQLGNGRTIVQYQGGVPPQLVQMNPTSPTSLALRDSIMNEIGTIFGVHQVSRGDPPKGITAAVALQFLNDQETERSISDIAKHNKLVVEIARISVSVAGDYYNPEDGRLLRILGKNNKHMVVALDTAALNKDYDFRLQNSTALPHSKAARMERIIQTMQYAPDLFTPDRWAELLEFGATEKMHTLITEAIGAAESEEEDMLNGQPVNEPQEWEDHLVHLRSHYKKMQSRTFKEDVPVQLREMFIEHVKVTEMLAEERALKNPLFASKLAQIEQYPMFWEAPVPMSAEHANALVQGQANQDGSNVTAQIPATEPDIIPGQQTKTRGGV